MPIYELNRHDITLFKSASGADTRQVPAGSATIKIYRKGARVSAPGSVGAPGIGVVNVYDIGTVGAGDTVVIGTNVTTGTVNSITLTSATVNWSGAVSWDAGDRLIPTNRQPTAYANSQGTESLGSTVTTDATSGGVAFYTRPKDIDTIATVGAQSRVIEDQHGQGVGGSLNPFDWGIQADGATDDAAALTDLISYAVLKGASEVRLPPGTILVGSSISITANSFSLVGAGRGVTILQCSDNAVSVVSTVGSTDCQVRDMTIKRSSAGAAGSSLVLLSGTRPALRNLAMESGAVGILDASTDATIEDIVFTGGSWEKLVSCAAATRSHYRDLRSRFTNDIGATSAAIYISDSCTGLRFTSCDIAPSNVGVGGNSGIGVYVRAAATASKDVVFTGCRFSGGTKTGSERAAVWVENGNSIEFDSCTVEDSFCGYDIDGGKDISIIGGRSVGQRRESVDIDGGTAVRIANLASSDVSQEAALTYNHVDIAGTVSDVYIDGLIVGSFIRGGAIDAPAGVYIGAGAGDRIMVSRVGGVEADVATFINNAKTGTASKSILISHNMAFGTAASASHDGVGLNSRTYSDGDTSPSVINVGVINYTFANPVVITSLDDGYEGQIVLFKNTGASTVTFNHSAGGPGFFNAGGANHVLGANDQIVYMKTVPGNNHWVQISELVNIP